MARPITEFSTRFLLNHPDILTILATLPVSYPGVDETTLLEDLSEFRLGSNPLVMLERLRRDRHLQIRSVRCCTEGGRTENFWWWLPTNDQAGIVKKAWSLYEAARFCSSPASSCRSR